jgi:SpoVK/Ycf46/Vps4 family AAA+-type ATPase
MENKLSDKEILNNLSNSFNLEDLHKLLNISFENFKIAKEYQEKNSEESYEKFKYSMNILSQLDSICNNNKCNKEIKKKIKKAIVNIEQIFNKHNSQEENEIQKENDNIENIKDIQQINRIHEGGNENNNLKLLQEAIIPEYGEIDQLLDNSIQKISNKETSKIDSEGENKIKHEKKNISEISNFENTEKKNDTEDENNKDKLFYLVNDKYRNVVNKYIIQPLNYPELYKKNFNSILFYGYKGNGKSFIVKNLLKEINNIIVIKKQINIKDISDDNQILSEKFSDIDKTINECQKKVIITIEDIDMLTDKKNSEYFYEIIYKYSQRKNVFIIATSNSPWKLNKNINEIFDTKIHIEFPDIEDINKYFMHKIFEYLDVEKNNHLKYKAIEEQIKHYNIFNIPILNNIKNINKISKKCQDKKCSYYDLNIIMNKLFNVTALSSIKNNIFQKELLHKVYFINSTSIFEKNYNQRNTYVINPPEYTSIIYKGTNYETYNYSDKNLLFEDERINNIYINNKTVNDKIDIIAEFNLEISNNINNEYNDVITKINKIILEIYINLFKNILFNVTSIVTNDKKVFKQLNNVITDNINELNKLNNLDDFLFLSDNIKDKIINLFSRSDIVNNYEQFKKIYSKCLNTLIQTITFEEGEYNYNIIYNGNNSNKIEKYSNGIPSDMEDPDEMRDLIKKLISGYNSEKFFINDIECDIQVLYLKKDKNISWNIEVVADYKSNEKLTIELFDIEIIRENKKYDVSPAIDISFNFIDLDDQYKITNESDVFLLQENYPEDYQEIYKDEINTWLLKPIKKNKHLDFLKKSYSGYQKFFLNLYHNLLQYQKCSNYINNLCKQKLDKIIKDIEIKIENILNITQDYDESVEKEIEKWKISSNHEDYNLENFDEYSYQNKNKYSVNFLLIKDLLEIMCQFKSINDIMKYYERSISGNFINKKNTIFVKSYVDKNKINNFYYSNYLNENQITDNNYLNPYYFEIMKEKILKNKSLYFEIFINSEEIGILKENNIQWYTINNTDNNTKKFLKSGEFAISNRTIDFVYDIFKNTCNQEINSNVLSYIISSIYMNEYKIDNIIKLYLGIVLYNKKLVMNIDNENIDKNTIQIIENSIINNFDSIKQLFIYIKKNAKNISIPEIPDIKSLFSHTNENSTIKKNETFFYSEIQEQQNISNRKIYSEAIEKKFDYSIEQINSSLRSFNLRQEYLEEIVKTYNCYNNIETLQLLENFN